MIKDILYVGTLDQIPLISVSLLSISKKHDHHLNIHYIYYSQKEKPYQLKLLLKYAIRLGLNLKTYNLKEFFYDKSILSIAHMPPHMWRLAAPALINVPSLLYIDSDTLVCKNLSGILELDFNGNSICARVDYASKFEIFLSYVVGDTYSSDDPYLNSGVIAWDLQSSREAGDTEAFVTTALSNWEECFRPPYPQPDQIVLNLVFHKRWLKMDPTYNAFIREPEMVGAHILHFLGSTKPWSPRTPVKLTFQYWLYLLRTPYKLWKFSAFLKRFTNPELAP